MYVFSIISRAVSVFTNCDRILYRTREYRVFVPHDRGSNSLHVLLVVASSTTHMVNHFIGRLDTPHTVLISEVLDCRNLRRHSGEIVQKRWLPSHREVPLRLMRVDQRLEHSTLGPPYAKKHGRTRVSEHVSAKNSSV